MRFLETVGKRLDQSPFDRTGVSGVGARKLDMLEAAPGRAVGLGVAMFLPGQIVEGPGGVSDAPMHHGASGIALQRLLEALDAFLVVEAVAPVQADIEPALGFRRAGGDGAPIGAKVEAIHAAFFLSHSWRPARTAKSIVKTVRRCQVETTPDQVAQAMATRTAESRPNGLQDQERFCANQGSGRTGRSCHHDARFGGSTGTAV